MFKAPNQNKDQTYIVRPLNIEAYWSMGDSHGSPYQVELCHFLRLLLHRPSIIST